MRAARCRFWKSDRLLPGLQFRLGGSLEIYADFQRFSRIPLPAPSEPPSPREKAFGAFIDAGWESKAGRRSHASALQLGYECHPGRVLTLPRICAANPAPQAQNGFSLRRSCRRSRLMRCADRVFHTKAASANTQAFHLIRPAFGGPPSPPGEGFWCEPGGIH